jgi:CubicO group peptidase (beta-lactamase class C family)
VWSHAYGVRGLHFKLPATTETVFPIASLTKTMTALLAMQMVDAGKLSLDDPVNKYLSDSDVEPSTRIRHYLSHTSEGAPGSRFSYNSGRYQRLAPILEKVSGKSLRALLGENLLDKLHMDQTIPGLEAAREHGQRYERWLINLARPHVRRAGELVEVEFPPERLDGASGVISSVLDLANYVAALRGATLVSVKSKNLMWTAAVSTSGKKLPYGLGWFVEDYRGQKLVWHYGQEAGFSSLILMVPGRDLALILLANSSAMSEPFWLLYGDAARSPFALAFLRDVVLPKTPAAAPPKWDLAAPALADELARRERAGFDSANELLDHALALSWTGDAERSADLFKLAVRNYPRLRVSAGAALLSVFARSSDAVLQSAGVEIGRALLAAAPNDPRTMFDLGVLLLHMQRGGEAAPLFQGVVAKPNATNSAVLAWSAYLLADILQESDPAQARACLKTAIGTHYDDGSLQQDAEKLLEKLSRR